MKSARIRELAILCACTALFACGGGDELRALGYEDVELARRDALGWLGARSHPIAAPLELEDEGLLRSPGGVVLREIDPRGALAAAGARSGDVVVRVGDTWLPLKEDPTLDLVALVEQDVSGNEQRIELGVWRAGALVALELAVDRPALEVGLPVEVKRFRDGAAAAVDRLVAWQGAEGGWSDPRAPSALALDALAGLALVAAGAASDDAPPALGDALARVEARIASEAGSAAQQSDALGLAFAVAFQAERVGALPQPVLARAAPRVIAIGGASSSPGAAPMIVFGGAGGLPEGFELPEGFDAGGAEMQIVSISGGDLPEGLELPEGAEIHFDALPSCAAPIEGGASAPGAPSEQELRALLEELAPERLAALEPLGLSVGRLLATQGEDGGFGAAEGDGRLFASAFALAALGAAQRAGLELESEPIEKSARFLRGLAHEGKVAAAVARGADRRDEAGRAGAVALAFLALGCPETDPFVSLLVEYSDESGVHLLGASSELPLQVLATALLRRGRGLATWASFYQDFRIALVAWQRPDGAFEIPAGRERDAASDAAGSAYATAIGALVLALQEERLELLLGKFDNPFAPKLDGEGRRGGSSAAPEVAAPGTHPDEMQALLESLGVEGEVVLPAGSDGDDR